MEADSGEQGLTMVKQHPPDLVILDLILPGLPGIEVLRKIRAHSPTRFTPVLVLTNVKDEENKQKALSSGANYFANKESVTDQHILKIVNDLLGIR